MRLLTRSDFDGLVSAVFLEEQGVINEYKFVHPKDIQDGKVNVSSNDVLANIPYVSGCGLWFDHHISEEIRLKINRLDFKGDCRPAPSAAQIIWDYYGGRNNFGDRFLPLLEAVNKSDTGSMSRDEILYPKGWVLLSYVMDPRTGLGRFKDYRISNYQLMEDMIQYCRTLTISEILEIEDVKERVDRYFEQHELHNDMLNRCCFLDQNVIVTDLLNEETIYSGNRFMVYALFPEQNIEVRIIWGLNKQNVVFTCGHSILNRTSKTNVGSLMLAYGGGGHATVGTCQAPVELWEQTRDEIVAQMKRDG